MANYEIQELVEWDNRVREKAAEFGLTWFPQEFEICDHVSFYHGGTEEELTV